MPDSEDRAHVFEDEFNFFMNYWSDVDEGYMDSHDYAELSRQDPFVGRIFLKLQYLSSDLSFSELCEAINLVWAELKRHKLFKKLAPLLKLYAFLKRVQQSERDYWANKKIEKRKRTEEYEKACAEREKEREKRRLRGKGLMTPSPEPDDTSSLMARGRESPLKDPYLSD